MDNDNELKCACGADPGPEWKEIATLFASVPPLCPTCEAKSEQETRRQKRAFESDEQARLIAERLAEIPPESLASDLDDERFNQRLWEAVSQWSPTQAKGLGIVGPPGRCKTRCLALLAEKLIKEGRHLVWVTACEFQNLVDDLMSKRPQRNEPAWDRIKEMKTAAVLVLDDIGKNTWSPIFERHFFELLDFRKGRFLPVLWSANHTPTELVASGELSEERGGAIFGRLAQHSKQIVIKSE